MIPNGDYLTLAGVAPDDISAILCGVPRSGTIWAWQILCDLMPGGVIHTHEYLVMKPYIPVVCTIRDPRDCLASNWRVDRPVGLDHCTRERLFWYAANLQRFCWIVRQYIDRRGALLVRYEKMMADVPETIREVAAWVGVLLSVPQSNAIAARHSMKRNRQLQEQSPDGAFSRETLLHSRHVGKGEAGTWREWIAERDWPLLHELLGPLCEEWGYT